MTQPLGVIASAAGLCRFVDASPSPFHVVDTVIDELTSAGYIEFSEAEPWPSEPGRYVFRRGGSLLAFDTRGGGPFRIVGGHTDSPNLRLRQHHTAPAAGGLTKVGLEPYGGAWLHSWLDRDLGVAGRISYRSGASFRTELIEVAEPLLVVPSLAIHLSEDRKAPNVNPQRHLDAVWHAGDPTRTFIDFLAERADIDPDAVLGFELMTFDLTPSRINADGSLVSAPRLDNQGTCYAGTVALLAASAEISAADSLDADSDLGVSDLGSDPAIPVLVLFDHEEVGSGSDRGAASELLITALERIVLARGESREDFLREMRRAVIASGDMAHATHPNLPERHEPSHQIEVGGGPVLKVNQNLRYASDSEGEAVFALAAAQANVPLQRYMHRADLPCGSTIGPITAARTGISTVDVGAPQLAMHSARELMGSADIVSYAAALAAFLAPRG